MDSTLVIEAFIDEVLCMEFLVSREKQCFFLRHGLEQSTFEAIGPFPSISSYTFF